MPPLPPPQKKGSAWENNVFIEVHSWEDYSQYMKFSAMFLPIYKRLYFSDTTTSMNSLLQRLNLGIRKCWSVPGKSVLLLTQSRNCMDWGCILSNDENWCISWHSARHFEFESHGDQQFSRNLFFFVCVSAHIYCLLWLYIRNIWTRFLVK
jgi:hypothetical protein